MYARETIHATRDYRKTLVPKKAGERHFLEAALLNAEVAVDSLVENSAVAAIPVIGTAIKLCKGFDDLRSRAFLAKLRAFVEEPHLRHALERDDLALKIADSTEEAIKVGETMFLVLEQFVDLYKPELLAIAFVAFLDGVLSGSDLRRLSQAISAAFSDDLQQLVSAPEPIVSSDGLEGAGCQWLITLVPSGLSAMAPRGVGVESPRVLRRLQPLRRWSYEQVEQVLT